MMPSSLKQMGYFFLDHRASPGFTEDEARAVGYDPKLVGGGRVYEADTLTCSHCKSVVIKNHLRQRERNFCVSCYHYICDGCAYLSTLPDYVHRPFERIVDEAIDGKLPQLKDHSHGR
jgi:hypothetical protein